MTVFEPYEIVTLGARRLCAKFDSIATLPYWHGTTYHRNSWMKVLKIHKVSTGDKIGRYVYIPSFLIVIICYVSYYVPDDFREYRESIISILIAFLVTYIIIQGYNTRDNPHGSPDAPTQHAVSYENVEGIDSLSLDKNETET